LDTARLHKYAGHPDFKTTMRYIHPREESMQEAMDKAKAARDVRLARGGHNEKDAQSADSAAQTVTN
jgi:hypothetical protein